MTFVDNPAAVNEKKKDPNIEATLLKELPGIINRALEGLKLLRDNNGFIETTDQNSMTEDFKTLSDPLSGFIEDVVDGKNYKMRGEFTRQEVFS